MKQSFIDRFVPVSPVSPNFLQESLRSQDYRSEKTKWVVDAADGTKDFPLRCSFIWNVSFETERVRLAIPQDPQCSLYWKSVKIQIQIRDH